MFTIPSYAAYISCSCVMTFSHGMNLLIFSVNFLAWCNYVYTLSLATSLNKFSDGYLVLCNCFYASALQHPLIYSLLFFLHFATAFMPSAWRIVFLLSKFMSCWAFFFFTVMLSRCFCFFSAAGLAGYLVILHVATLSCWAFFSAVMLSHCFCFFSAAGLLDLGLSLKLMKRILTNYGTVYSSNG